MKNSILKEDAAVSKTTGAIVIVVISVLVLSSLLITGGIKVPTTSTPTVVKADAATKFSSSCNAYGYNTTVCIDVTNFTLHSVSNSEIYLSLVITNSSGSFVYYGYLGNNSLSPYFSTINSSSKSFAVNSDYKIHIYGTNAPSSISANISYSNSVIYSSGQIKQSSSPSSGYSSASINLISNGNTASGFNTSIFLNVSGFSNGKTLNSNIAVVFSIYNSTGFYDYKGYLDGNIINTTTGASPVTLISDQNYFSGGSDYVISLFNYNQTTSISLRLIYCGSSIYDSGIVV